MNPYPHFSQAVSSLGNTDTDRANRLGVSRRKVIDLRQGKLPLHLRLLAHQPELLRALAADAEALADTEEETTGHE